THGQARRPVPADGDHPWDRLQRPPVTVHESRVTSVKGGHRSAKLLPGCVGRSDEWLDRSFVSSGEPMVADISRTERAEPTSLETRISAMLPSQYHLREESISPTSMGSASLKYGPDARVAWNAIWTSFCDLAVAGGPPHRASLLAPPSGEGVEAEPAGDQLVPEELVRAIRMTTGLPPACFARDAIAQRILAR